MRAKSIRSFKLSLYEPDVEIIEKIQNEQHLVVGEVIRNLLRGYGEKHFNTKPTIAEVQLKKIEAEKEDIRKKEKEIKDWEDLDPKKYVIEVLKGEVDEVNQMALFCHAVGGSTRKIPLNKIKETPKNDIFIRHHLELVDGTYIYLGGVHGPEQWDKEKCAEVLNKWRTEVRKELFGEQ